MSELNNLRRRVSELSEELYQLRQVLQARRPFPWKLSCSQGQILTSLYDAAGRLLTYEHLGVILGTRCSSKRVGVHICYLRKRIPSSVVIINHPGIGYSLPMSSRQEIDRLSTITERKAS